MVAKINIIVFFTKSPFIIAELILSCFDDFTKKNNNNFAKNLFTLLKFLALKIQILPHILQEQALKKPLKAIHVLQAKNINFHCITQ